ncbi:MAG: glycoside hydrolase family 16 protein [Labilibaculum sp.]|nr:glycoside hydrolase family 16 protein [Labilibaculum sp.]MBI9059300.1 glycoside hydrolase family 16 protein [Labilibaculum sp.]
MLLKHTIILSGVLFLLSSCNWKKSETNSEKTEDSQKDTYELVWSDEFDCTGLPDSTKWIYDTEGNADGWGNREAQHYTIAKKENAWVENGILNITAQKEQFEGKEYTSARLNSNVSWLHGRIEVNAKLPKGRGTWSAIWMMPKDWTFKDGDWPNIGEIDIMEHVGHNLGTIHASAHSKDYQWQTNTQQTDTIQIADVAEKFHSYVWEWTPELMKAYVDDKLYFEYKNEGLGKSKWPYIKPFYLILNVAVGGAWGNVEGIDNSAFPQTMEIDYVRIYQKK